MGKSKSKRMSKLGRKGGLVGGPARARALGSARRAAIARRAARVRWSRAPLAANERPDLPSFVAHYGSTVTPMPADAPLETLALRALRASRRDAAIARMLPVFFWRVRRRLDLERLAAMAERQQQVQILGFFLQAAAELGRTRRFDRVLGRLRRRLRLVRTRYLFLDGARQPFERMAADLSTPAQARRWGLRMNMGWDSFADHFRKAAPL